MPLAHLDYSIERTQQEWNRTIITARDAFVGLVMCIVTPSTEASSYHLPSPTKSPIKGWGESAQCYRETTNRPFAH